MVCCLAPLQTKVVMCHSLIYGSFSGVYFDKEPELLFVVFVSVPTKPCWGALI